MADSKHTWVKQTGLVTQSLSAAGGLGIACYTAYLTLNDGEVLTALVATPLMGFLGWIGLRTFAAAILYPVAWSLVSLVRGYRRAKGTVAVLQRTGALRTARADTLAWRAANHQATTLPRPTLAGVAWARAALWRRALPYLRMLMLLVTVVIGITTCSDGFQAVGFALSLIPAGLFVALLMLPSGALDARAAEHVAHALRAPLKASGDKKRGWLVKMPSGASLHMGGLGMANSPWGLSIGLTCRTLPFDLMATSRTRLEDEAGDLDLGHPAFDEATLLMPHTPLARADLSSAWLLEPLRLHLLWALSNGARLHEGQLVAEVDLRHTNALVVLDELVLAFDGVQAAVDARPSSQSARALEALRAARGETQRGAIVRECLHLERHFEAAQVWQAWVEQGRGPTRVDAAVRLGRQAGPAWATLTVIAEDPEELPAQRAHALRLGLPWSAAAATLLSQWVRAEAAKPLVALAEQLMAQETQLEAEAPRRLAQALAVSAPAPAVQVPLAAVVVALGPAAVEAVGSAQLVAWLGAEVTTTETHTALSLLVDASPEGSAGVEVRAAAIQAWTALLSRLEGRRGGLAMVTEAEGGLELVD